MSCSIFTHTPTRHEFDHTNMYMAKMKLMNKKTVCDQISIDEWADVNLCFRHHNLGLLQCFSNFQKQARSWMDTKATMAVFLMSFWHFYYYNIRKDAIIEAIYLRVWKMCPCAVLNDSDINCLSFWSHGDKMSVYFQLLTSQVPLCQVGRFQVPEWKSLCHQKKYMVFSVVTRITPAAVPCVKKSTLVLRDWVKCPLAYKQHCLYIHTVPLMINSMTLGLGKWAGLAGACSCGEYRQVVHSALR